MVYGESEQREKGFRFHPEYRSNEYFSQMETESLPRELHWFALRFKIWLTKSHKNHIRVLMMLTYFQQTISVVGGPPDFPPTRAAGRWLGDTMAQHPHTDSPWGCFYRGPSPLIPGRDVTALIRQLRGIIE